MCIYTFTTARVKRRQICADRFRDSPAARAATPAENSRRPTGASGASGSDTRASRPLPGIE